MRVIKIGDAELEAHKAELLSVLNRDFNFDEGDIEQQLVCDECGTEGQQMLRIEVGEEKRLHDLCAACLARGITMLDEVK